MKLSAIDIGSNSVRLGMFADGKTLYKRRITTRLGEGLSISGVMKPEAIERTAKVVSDFVSTAKSEGAQKVYAFATASVRSASNGNEFCERVFEMCGQQVDVISGECEANIGLLGALKNDDGGLIDIGGASTEVTVRENGKIIFAKSANIGTVRLNDLAGYDIEKLKAVISDRLDYYGDFRADKYNMCAVSGTATTLAFVKHRLKEYDPSVVHGTVITREEAKNFAYTLLNMSVEDIKNKLYIVDRTADIIGGGALLLYMLMERLRIDKVTVSENDNLEGYIFYKEGVLCGR